MAASDLPVQPELVETQASVQDRQAQAAMRAILADTYTFVRSTEINKTILSFTFDHYIDEAKRAIKEDRILRSASDPVTGVGKRPSKLSALQKLQTDFNNSLSQLQQVAQSRDAPNSGAPQT
jgi:hypothetical protein